MAGSDGNKEPMASAAATPAADATSAIPSEAAAESPPAAAEAPLAAAEAPPADAVVDASTPAERSPSNVAETKTASTDATPADVVPNETAATVPEQPAATAGLPPVGDAAPTIAPTWPRAMWRRRLLAVLLSVFTLALPPAFVATQHVGDLPLRAGVLLIASGTSATTIGEMLRAQLDVAAPSLLVRLYMRLRGDASRLRAGEFRISDGDTLTRALDRIVAGDVVRYQVTLIEGMDVSAALQRLAEQEAIRRTLAGADRLLETLGVGSGIAEGRFLPDTYTFVRGDSDADVLRQAHARMQQVLDEEWRNRAPDLPYANADEALTLASLIEKETGSPDDRDLIAGVFVARLRLGMLLQSDPTVIYALGEAFDGNLRREDLRKDLAFNTYMRPGLPPAPIALPGRAAIHAALHPREAGYLYFVARGDGSSEFSRTLPEHNAAVDRYQRNVGARSEQ